METQSLFMIRVGTHAVNAITGVREYRAVRVRRNGKNFEDVPDSFGVARNVFEGRAGEVVGGGVAVPVPCGVVALANCRGLVTSARVWDYEFVYENAREPAGAGEGA